LAFSCWVALIFRDAVEGVTPIAVMVGADEPPLDPPDELLLEPVDPQPANRKIEKLRIRTVERRNNDIVWIGPSFFQSAWNAGSLDGVAPEIP